MNILKIPKISNKNDLVKIQNINLWQKFNKITFRKKIKIATKLSFNRYIYYHLADIDDHLEHIFHKACEVNNLEIIELVLKKVKGTEETNIWELGLYGACKGGNFELVQQMIEKGASEWECALLGACRGGHFELVLQMIEKGAYDWNRGLYGACIGGHLQIVQLMIEKGAYDWNRGLYGACNKGHLEVVKMMIMKGANNWNLGLEEACFFQ